GGGGGGGVGGGGAHGHTRAPGRAHRVDGLEGGNVAQVVTGEQDGRRIALGGQGGDRGALVHAARPQFDDQPAGLGVQPGLAGEVRQRAGQQCQRRLGVGGPAGVHDQRGALVLHPPAPGRAGRGGGSGERGAGLRDLGRRRG